MDDHRLQLYPGHAQLLCRLQMNALFALAIERDKDGTGDKRTLPKFKILVLPEIAEYIQNARTK